MNTSISSRKLRDSRIGAAVAASLLLAAAALPAGAGTPTGGGVDDAAPAKKASKPESMGVASGFAVGAAAGGPIGALVGAAAGGWLGDRMHREPVGHASTREQLAVAERRGAGLTLNLMFRTEEATLRSDDEPMLAQFASIARATPAAVVHVTGFADPRGTPRYNAALATQRAEGIAARLVAAGIAADRLVISSEVAAASASEAATTPADLDGYAFQRRVTLRIEVPTATSPDAALAQRR